MGQTENAHTHMLSYVCEGKSVLRVPETPVFGLPARSGVHCQHPVAGLTTTAVTLSCTLLRPPAAPPAAQAAQQRPSHAYCSTWPPEPLLYAGGQCLRRAGAGHHTPLGRMLALPACKTWRHTPRPCFTRQGCRPLHCFFVSKGMQPRQHDMLLSHVHTRAHVHALAFGAAHCCAAAAAAAAAAFTTGAVSIPTPSSQPDRQPRGPKTSSRRRRGCAQPLHTWAPVAAAAGRCLLWQLRLGAAAMCPAPRCQLEGSSGTHNDMAPGVPLHTPWPCRTRAAVNVAWYLGHIHTRYRSAPAPSQCYTDGGRDNTQMEIHTNRVTDLHTAGCITCIGQVLAVHTTHDTQTHACRLPDSPQALRRLAGWVYQQSAPRHTHIPHPRPLLKARSTHCRTQRGSGGRQYLCS
jgi:hypothetical protein